MKFKNLSLIFLFIFAFSFAGFSQVDDEEAEMFGSKRDINFYSKYDFGSITNDVQEHEFTITNNSLKPMTITEFIIPDGVGVILVDKVIESKEDGKFIVTVNKQYMENLKNDKFELEVIVKTAQNLQVGVTTITESIYIIKGSFE